MDVNQLVQLIAALEPENPNMTPSWAALNVALFSPDAFTPEQVQVLAANAQAEYNGGFPVMPPLWFSHIEEQLAVAGQDDLWHPEDDQDWQPPEEEDPDGVAQGQDAVAEGSDPEEEENPKPFRGRGKRTVRMPYDEFVAEHKHLLDVLSKGDRTSLREEYTKQKEELGRHGRF